MPWPDCLRATAEAALPGILSYSTITRSCEDSAGEPGMTHKASLRKRGSGHAHHPESLAPCELQLADQEILQNRLADHISALYLVSAPSGHHRSRSVFRNPQNHDFTGGSSRGLIRP
jgi:hypothetical protein